MNISTRLLDIISIVISFACIVHCLFFPALLILLPTLLSSINNELIHIILLVFIYPISIYAIYFGFKKHHNKTLFSQGILGILILIFCGVMLYTEKQTASEMAGWLTVGLLFLRSKDSLIALPKE